MENNKFGLSVLLVGFAILLVTVAFIGGATAEEQLEDSKEIPQETAANTFSQCGGEQGCRSSCGCGCGGNPDACGCGG